MSLSVQKEHFRSDGLSERWHEEAAFTWNDVSFVHHKWEAETFLFLQQIF